MEYTLPQLFKTLIDQGGSDLHVSAGSPPRLRIDGQIVPLNLPPLTTEESAELCYSILTESQKKVFETEKELDLSFAVKNLARFRSNIYFESHAVAGAFRVIPFKINTLTELGVPRVLEKLCALRRGLVLVTGPTGSGKSTTLAAMVNQINETRFDHIVTIEDPIEFVHNHKNCIVNQREVGGDTDSFQNAMKSVLRQDPDVILVGELRDLETISSALTLAETGHLVFGTLHTNTAVSSINRIVDAFPPHQQHQIRTQLSMTLEAVISQNLLPARIGGRVLALEILMANQPVRALINEGKVNQIYSAIQSGQSDSGMLTMNQSLYSLYRQQRISKEQALSYSPNQEEMLDILSKGSSSSKTRR